MKQIALTALFLATVLCTGAQAENDSSESGQSSQNSKQDKQTKKNQKADTGPIKLESVFVGDKEQPAISYFIPWQGVGAPDKLHWNVEEKHDKALEPVDREVMLRSIQLYDQLQLEAPGD